MRHLPVPWREKAKTLLSTQSQATWGQGAHQLPNDIKALNVVRSSLMRTFFNSDFYSMSPLLTFALLVPVQLEPTFAMQYSGLLTFQSCIANCAHSALLVQQIINAGVSETVGPCARVQEFLDGPLDQPVRQLLMNQIDNLELWKHNLSGRTFSGNSIQKGRTNTNMHPRSTENSQCCIMTCSNKLPMA